MNRLPRSIRLKNAFELALLAPRFPYGGLASTNSLLSINPLLHTYVERTAVMMTALVGTTEIGAGGTTAAGKIVTGASLALYSSYLTMQEAVPALLSKYNAATIHI